jgi:hypothetical protein
LAELVSFQAAENPETYIPSAATFNALFCISRSALASHCCTPVFANVPVKRASKGMGFPLGAVNRSVKYIRVLSQLL